MTAKAVHDGPCRYNRRPPHAHRFVRGVCHRCGARDETTVDETPWRELEAARVEFRKACDALDLAFGNKGVTAEVLTQAINFRNRIDALRVQESKWVDSAPV